MTGIDSVIDRVVLEGVTVIVIGATVVQVEVVVVNDDDMARLIQVACPCKCRGHRE